MNLSIISDFCSWWWLWWIGPFILGLLLGATFWRKYMTKVTELEESLARHKSTIYDLESNLKKSKRELVHNDVALEDARKEKTRMLKQHSADLAKANKSNQVIGTSSLVSDAQKERTLDLSRLEPTNLNIVEGIDPKIETILHANGIKNWKLLSSKSKGELRNILSTLDGEMSKVDPSTWPKQAFKAMNRDWDGLIVFQKSSFGDSKLLKVLHRLNQTS